MTAVSAGSKADVTFLCALSEDRDGARTFPSRHLLESRLGVALLDNTNATARSSNQMENHLECLTTTASAEYSGYYSSVDNKTRNDFKSQTVLNTFTPNDIRLDITSEAVIP